MLIVSFSFDEKRLELLELSVNSPNDLFLYCTS